MQVVGGFILGWSQI